MQRRILAGLALGLLAATSSARTAEPAVVRWDLTVMGTDAPYSSWLEMTREGEKLSGRFVGRFGSARQIKQIEFKGGNLRFSLPPQFENMKVDLVFSGKLAGGKLSGTTNGEDGAQLKWSGVRAPALKPRANPKWGAPIQLDDFGKPAESHGMGGLYGFLTPKLNATKKAGEWQKMEVTVLGRQLTVVLNDQPLIDKQEIPGITGGAFDSDEGAPGPIMLQGDHGKVWYRTLC